MDLIDLRRTAMADEDLSASARLLFTAILEEYPDGDLTLQHLGNRVALSERSAQRRKKELVQAGYLSAKATGVELENTSVLTGDTSVLSGTPSDVSGQDPSSDKHDSTDGWAPEYVSTDVSDGEQHDSTDGSNFCSESDPVRADGCGEAEPDSTDGSKQALKVLSAGPGETPSRQKKVSTPSKKNSTSPSDLHPSLRSGFRSGDGLPDADWSEFFVSLPEDDTQHPAVGCYRSFAEMYPGEYDRKRLVDAVGETGSEKFSNRMGHWRETCEEWRANGWNWGNFDGLLSRFMDKLEAHGLINRTDYTREIEVEDDTTAEQRGYAHLLPDD